VEKIDTFFEHQDTRGYKFDIDSRGNVFIVEMEKDEHASVIDQLQSYLRVPNGGVTVRPPINFMVNSGKKNSFWVA
jgi:hypothetical protein